MLLQKKVSIIIPVYNAELYLEACLESVLSQTYENIEVILINDGSTDSSGDICESYALKDLRINVFHQVNKGPSAARNKGIKYSTGDFIQFVDADDEIEEYMTETLLFGFSNEIDLVICGYRSVRQKRNKIISEKVLPHQKGSYSIGEFIHMFPELYSKWLINSPCNKLYNTNLIKNNRIIFNKEIRNGEDLLFNISYLKECRNIYLLSKTLYSYNKFNNPYSLTKNYKENFLKSRKKLFCALYKFLLEGNQVYLRNKKLLREIYSNYTSRIFSNLFDSNDNFNPWKRNILLKEILDDTWITKYFNFYLHDNIKRKILGYLIKKRSLLGLNLYFKARNFKDILVRNK